MATTYRTGDRVQIQAPISRSPLGSAVIIEQGKKNPEIFHVRQEWDNRTGWVHIGRMHPATEESPVVADVAMDNGRCQHRQPTVWIPEYSEWRHGGWYVHNVRYASGAIGCVSRNYPDGKWRIVCGDHDRTFKTRDEAARAEYVIAESSKINV